MAKAQLVRVLTLLALLACATPAAGQVAFEAATESVRTLTTDPWTFACSSPGGAPRGVVLTAVHGVSSTDHIAGVTYGGAALTRAKTNTDTATELGRADVWFLGSAVPTGTSTTVSVDLTSATSDDFQFVCITLTAGDDTEVIDSDGINNDATNPSVTLQYGGRTAIALAALYGGGAAPTSFTPNANSATLHDHDLGAFYAEVIRQSTPGTADFAIGGTSAVDDVAFAAVAVAQVVGGGPPAGNQKSLSLTGVGARR